MTPEERSQAATGNASLIAVEDCATGERLGHVLNMLRSGFLMISTRPIAEDSRHRLRLLAGGDAAKQMIEVTAEAVWCEGSDFSADHGVGFSIVEVHSGNPAQLVPKGLGGAAP